MQGLPTLAALKHQAAAAVAPAVVPIIELVLGNAVIPHNASVQVVGNALQFGSPNNGSHAEEALIYHHGGALAFPLVLQAQDGPCADGGNVALAHTNHWHDCEKLLLAVASHVNANVEFFADHCYGGSRVYDQWWLVLRQVLINGRPANTHHHGQGGAVTLRDGGVMELDEHAKVFPHITFRPDNTIELRAWL